MVNPGIILLAVFVFVLFLALAITIAFTVNAELTHTGSTGTTGLEPCSQTVDLDSLIQIPSDQPPCLQQGRNLGLYWIGDLAPFTYNYVVAPYGTQPLEVCRGFCTGFTGSGTGAICTGPVYQGKTAQENFNACMSQLTSTTCLPPVPIAAQGTTLYYALLPTEVCDN